MKRCSKAIGIRVVVLLVLIPALFSPTLAIAKVYLQGWDLVDSGKHMDYTMKSKYVGNLNTAVSTWNARHNVIRKDTASTINDVTISDYSKNDGITGVCSSAGTIKLNTYYLDNCTSHQKTNTVTHELGHGLRLGHSTSSDVMYATQTSRIALGANDKESYTYAYNNRY
jgi:predicted Zn-dependent protease